MSKLYTKSYFEKLQLIKGAQVLKPLLLDLKIEESTVPEFLMSGKLSITVDFKRPFIICSSSQIYKTISVYGIVNNFDRTVKYQSIDLSSLLDIWYQSSTIIPKDKLLCLDIVIIRGRDDKWLIENKKRALVELVEIRKMRNKPTWLFMEDMTIDKFTELYPKMVENFGQIQEIKI